MVYVLKFVSIKNLGYVKGYLFKVVYVYMKVLFCTTYPALLQLSMSSNQEIIISHLLSKCIRLCPLLYLVENFLNK